MNVTALDVRGGVCGASGVVERPEPEPRSVSVANATTAIGEVTLVAMIG